MPGRGHHGEAKPGHVVKGVAEEGHLRVRKTCVPSAHLAEGQGGQGELLSWRGRRPGVQESPLLQVHPLHQVFPPGHGHLEAPHLPHRLRVGQDTPAAPHAPGQVQLEEASLFPEGPARAEAEEVGPGLPGKPLGLELWIAEGVVRHLKKLLQPTGKKPHAQTDKQAHPTPLKVAPCIGEVKRLVAERKVRKPLSPHRQLQGPPVLEAGIHPLGQDHPPPFQAHPPEDLSPPGLHPGQDLPVPFRHLPEQGPRGERPQETPGMGQGLQGLRGVDLGPGQDVPPCRTTGRKPG